ncbi:serine protease DegQ [Methylacidimicrobium cyclopophantes]|uniref:Serine protease DegQ n=1 Tax=Methylacidimicrobium cyclopophantes TaxID=1041766 RepID=A0A5E6MHC0_9BACT|nr:trypsin-like peptidase domain-containing protein [Methylacidimicrobium cyclopophantes]VVM08424.1 serine protease DegQ [Methylacidimicrobium cyclopophantes]
MGNLRRKGGSGWLAAFWLLCAARGWAEAPADEPAVQVVQKVLPAVANINAERIVRRQVQDPFELFFGRYYSYSERVRSLGSGVVVAPEGFVITCAHVVGRAVNRAVKVSLSQGKDFQAKVLFEDPVQDLALLKVEAPKALPWLDIRRLSPNLLGQTVIVLGNPVGYQSSVSKGILSAKGRMIQTEEGAIEGLLQTDAAINPGNSGGPLVDLAGAFVGLSSAKFSGEAIEGIGFAIPGDRVLAWYGKAKGSSLGGRTAAGPTLADLLEKRFGIAVQELTEDLAASFGVAPGSGLLIATVEKGSPAAAAGIEAGMILAAVGNTPVSDLGELPPELARIQPGSRTVLTITLVEQRGPVLFQRTQSVAVVAR